MAVERADLCSQRSLADCRKWERGIRYFDFTGLDWKDRGSPGDEVWDPSSSTRQQNFMGQLYG